MALSFEESKRLLTQLAATPAVSNYVTEPAVADTGIMTLDETYVVAAYSGDDGNWEEVPGYRTCTIFEDANISIINDTKDILLDGKQFNITQESHSQYIPFEMPQKYDGFDLSNASISIHYEDSNGFNAEDAPINVTCNGTKIRFGWLVSPNATQHAGKLKFEIIARGNIPDLTNDDGTPFVYVWKTKFNDSLMVLQALRDSNSDGVIDTEADWFTTIVEQVAQNVADQIANAELSGFVTEDELQGSINSALTDYYNKTETENYVRAQVDAIIIPEVPENISSFNNDAGYLTEIPAEYVTDIELNEKGYLTEHQSLDGLATETYVSGKLGSLTDDEGKELTVEQYVTKKMNEVDVSDQLGELGFDEEGNQHTVVSYVDKKIEEIDISDKLGTLIDNDGNELTVEEYVQQEVSEVNVSDQLVDYAKVEDVSRNTSSISSLNKAVEDINTTLAGIDNSPKVTYEATYGNVEMDDGSTAEYMFTLWETETGKEPTVKSRFQIMGGGGSTSSVDMKISYVDGYTTPIVATANDKVLIKYEFAGEDSAGDTNLDGTATWKFGNRIVATQEVSTGLCEFDATEYVNVGDTKVLLTITHATGAVTTKAWTIQIVDVRLESDFSDTKPYEAGAPVNFTFTPHGAVDKTVHFLLDGTEIGTKQSSAASSGLSDFYELPAKEHGTHLLEAYMTAVVGKKTVESEHIIKDIMWYDSSLDLPIIGCSKQTFTARQYEATNIEFTVVDPSTETPTVILVSSYVNEDGETVETYRSELTMTTAIHQWQYKTDIIGEHTLTIACGDVVKTLKATITDIGIEVTPITAGLVFDFNPVGYSNNDANRLWSYGEDIAMTVSPNFDWVNGGYQIDEDGNQYFCIKSGTYADINYELFGDDAKVNGKEMKLIFKTGSVADSEAVFLSCVSDADGTGKIGIEMKAQEATIYAKAESLPLPYAENRIIEFEFNISSDSQTPPMLMGYEDGVSTRPMVYDATHDFQQHKDYRKTITLGSPDCDLYIYRFKVYSKSLSDKDILNNFVADARSAEDMIDRHERNQIYNKGILDPDYLATVCPWLRVIKIEAPRFTTDKDDKVKDTIIEFIYKDGDPILDNFVAYDCCHSGQGTSSNNYGPAGRNLDLIMKTYKDYGNKPYIVLGDGSVVNKVALTRNSIPVNYFNVKVNIASSENANNALMAKRYNEFNPYKRPFVRPVDTLEDHYTAEEIADMTEEQKEKILAGYQAETKDEIAKIKDTMEFVNCVIFIKETSTDVEHTEFSDSNWHYYAIGNIGDSKKTDDTRLTDPNDPHECILEVMDNTLPNSTMPTGKVDVHGAPVYPIAPEEWCEGNSAYDALHADKFDEKKATDKENGLADTYGWRYIYEDGNDEENEAARAYVEQKWKDFYEFVVTSTDEEFKTHLGDWCVLDSVMYYYLFTLRYTMTDNHAKNSFWHYGKSNDVDENGDPIYKWDLSFFYDADTCLGIDNYGRMSYRYGYEEIDYVDGTSDWVWNAPQHVFFLRLRELFDTELCNLYTRLESLGCWSSTSLINQFDEWQAQFPEELWRVDIERKYIRTYTSSFINGPAKVEFLKERANGRKKHQRAQFEINQEKYMSSKFGGTVASSDDIILRCSVPNAVLTVPAKFDITLTPYSYVYLNVKYNTAPPIKQRAIPGQTYTVEYTGDLADIIEIYSASCMKSIGDMSPLYLINADFSNASKIRELTLGSSITGYNNTNEMTLGLGANELLNKLDIQNMSGLSHSLDLTGLKNLEELYAFGSSVSGVLFADGGNIHTVEIPSVGTLQMKNLSYLTDDGFEVTSLDSLSRLIAENSELDLVSLINAAPKLSNVRLTGIDWRLESTDLLDRLYSLAGVNSTGGNADQSILSGTVFVPTIKEQQLYNYHNAWPDLTVNYNTLVNQFAVTFMNPDGRVLDVQYVDKGSKPVDPTTRAVDPIDTPTLESTVSTDYTFAGWDSTFVETFSNTAIYATYSETIRQYTVTYVANGEVLQESVGDYGSVISYNGDLPTYVLEESAFKYYLFSGWDQNGYVDGDKTINAVFSSREYVEGYFDGKKLEDMEPVDVYMLMKLSSSGTVTLTDHVAAKDSVTLQLGADFNFPDIERELVSQPIVFDGISTYHDTNVTLMDEDRDFVIAIDCEMESGNASNAVLAQCFSALDTSGFRLFYNNGVKLAWGSNSDNPISVNKREMLVLRHIKGENGVHVYASNVAGNDSYYVELDGMHPMVHNVSVVFGCSKLEDGSYEQFAKGTVYWSKVWFADLGDDACKKLAYWPHEEMAFEACFEVAKTPKRYYLSDNSGKRSSLTLISSGVLAQPIAMDTSSTNAGGWASYDLNNYLNTRVYAAFQDEWRQLMKQVKVRSSIGEKSTETSSSDCYVFVPSVGELFGADTSSFNEEPFISEGTAISHFLGNTSRICYNTDGAAVQYWTRSPSLDWNAYVYRVSSTGTSQPVTQLNASDVYARIMISM